MTGLEDFFRVRIFSLIQGLFLPLPFNFTPPFVFMLLFMMLNIFASSLVSFKFLKTIEVVLNHHLAKTDYVTFYISPCRSPMPAPLCLVFLLVSLLGCFFLGGWLCVWFLFFFFF